MRRYTLVLIPDREDGGYSVLVPALPGLATQGDTREQALHMAREAIEFHLECLSAEGEPIPEDEILVERVEVDVDTAVARGRVPSRGPA